MTTGSTHIKLWKDNFIQIAAVAVRWIIEPSSKLDPKQRRRVRLLSVFLLLMTVSTAIGMIILKKVGGNAWIVLEATSIALLLGYFVSRTRYYRAALVVAVTIPALPPLTIALFKPPEVNLSAELMWLVLPLMVATLMLSVRQTIIVAIFYTSFIMALRASGLMEFKDLAPVMGFLSVIIFFVVVISVIRRRDQTEIENHLIELERAEELLKENNAKLAATNKELEAFSYSVSHDLRSPLRSIDGFSQALIEDYQEKLDETGQGYLKRLRSASQKMGELIDGILKLSRLTRSEMHHVPIDLSALAKEIATRLQETQPERKVKFIIDKELTANGDPQLLRVLLENLLGNAWKFTSKKPKTQIEFSMDRNNGKKAYFIRDNGAGFDMTYADKLFGAFQRLHDAAEFPGTGIGLATAQRIIHRHGGAIWAEGAVDKGATFHFTLD